MKPIFKKYEVVVKAQKPELNLGGVKEETTGTVVYVGEKTTSYKVGDKILFDGNRVRTINYFGDPLWKLEHEDHVFCAIDESL